MQYQSFSSLAPEEEKEFVVFEQRTVEAAKSANTIGWGIAGGMLLLTLLIVLGFWAPLRPAGGEEPEPKPAATAH